MINRDAFSPAVSIYIHVPFCLKKCNYCDFYSTGFNQNIGKKYLLALQKEISLYAAGRTGGKVKTIYFGGGTPSLLEPEQIGRILQQLAAEFSFAEQVEISMEANPSSLNKAKIKKYFDVGINRLSIGVQSFIDRELTYLGRLHTSAQAIQVIHEVASVFNNYSLDLIFALPGQSKQDWEYSLNRAIEIRPPHLSIYNLQIEQDTQLGRMYEQGQLTPLDEQLDAEMYLLAREMLQKAGYSQYEISNFALPGFRSCHNLTYWHYQPYLGLGPAAHGFTGQYRYYNYCSVGTYIEKLQEDLLPVEENISLTEEDLMAEMMMMGLRLQEGVSRRDFYTRFNQKLADVYADQLDKLNDKGLIIVKGDRLILSEKGLMLGNEVFMEFLP